MKAAKVIKTPNKYLTWWLSNDESKGQKKLGYQVFMMFSSMYELHNSFFWAKTDSLWKKYYEILPNLVFTASDVNLCCTVHMLYDTSAAKAIV